MRPYRNDDLFKANLEQIARDDPSLARILDGTVPSSRLVSDEGGQVNIDLGDGRLFYPDGAGQAAERQVAQYLETPPRFQIGANDVYEDCVELNWLYRALRQRLAPFPALPGPGPFGGFVVVFGMGLGLHLTRLAEGLRFKTMIVVEPVDELLVHSLHVLDWRRLTEDLARDGREIRIVRGDNPVLQILRIIRGYHYPFLDGSYFYVHYQTPELEAVIRHLQEQGRAMSMVSGWIEDQLIMMRNNAGNFARAGFRLLRQWVASPRTMPAFVVGAGPSLDADIEDIRRCRDSVVLISASSALKVLLEHGIRPDIHCELENSAGLATVAEGLAARHGGLADITLFASPTVNPGISPNFRQTIYFYRGQVSSTVFYAVDEVTTMFAEPTSGNTAVHCALALGFRDITLFGLDFGSRDPERHHSQHSVYFTYEDESEMATYTPYDMDKPVPGNLGGQVLTGWLLDWGRISVTNAIKGFENVRVRNCSDGALIALTTPMAAEALEITPSPLGREQELDRALAEMDLCESDWSRPVDLARLVETIHGFFDAALDAIAGIQATGQPPQTAIVAPIERIIALLTALENGDAVAVAAHRVVVGQVQGGLAAAFHYASRLAPDAAEPGLAAIRSSLTESYERLYPLIDTIFDLRP